LGVLRALRLLFANVERARGCVKFDVIRT
jgi:hypothetical protein